MPRRPALVAVHGLKRAGKGTVAGHLVRAHGYTNVKFSRALKDMNALVLRRVCGLDEATVDRCIEGDLKEVPIPSLGGKSGRYLMQITGTEWRDALDARMWTRISLAEMHAVWASGGCAVVDDLRFMHEVELIVPAGADLWMVESARPPVNAVAAALPWNPEAPASLEMGNDVLEDMLALFLGRCGLTPDEVVRSLGGELSRAGLDILGGHSARDCMEALLDVWLPLLRQPRRPSAASTSTHASEQGLPVDLFRVHLRNDGTIRDLENLVDEVLAGDARAAA